MIGTNGERSITYEILGLDGDTLSVNSSQVGVLEQRDKVSLSSLLEGHDGGGLEAKIRLICRPMSQLRTAAMKARSCADLEILSDFTNKTLEGELANEELSGLLVPSDFTKGDSSGTETVRLLDTTSGSL